MVAWVLDRMVLAWDFDGDLYGRDLTLFFIDRLRDELEFDSREDMSAQIARDVEAVRMLTADSR